tara:strand:+ start:98 stop:589 length:492 start_codon:yes stop_codon:yes gene_type:complete
MSTELWQEAARLVALEGKLLDDRNWDAWVDLYLETAEYWIPCWQDEYSLTDDPSSQISLIYYANRQGLEDRVFRLRTERSLASTPLPRTAHLSTITIVNQSEDGILTVGSNWSTYSYRLERQHVFFGQQTHEFKETKNGYRISKRKIIVANDKIPNVLDIYSV